MKCQSLFGATRCDLYNGPSTFKRLDMFVSGGRGVAVLVVWLFWGVYQSFEVFFLLCTFLLLLFIRFYTYIYIFIVSSFLKIFREK